MDDLFIHVYNILSEIDKLDFKIYNDLVFKYGEKLVDSVIDKMVVENADNVLKFEYYLNKISVTSDEFVPIGFDAYLLNIYSLPLNTADDNRKLLEEIRPLILELEDIFHQFDCYKNYDAWGRQSWLCDKVEYCAQYSSSSVLLSKMNSIYKKFVEKRNIIVEQNLRLVVSFARKYSRQKITMDELVQIGTLGIIKAIEKFDPSRDSCFSTYAYYWVRCSLNKGIGEICYFLNVPTDGIQQNRQRLNALDDLKRMNGCTPTDSEIAKYMGISLSQAEKLRCVFNPSVSLDEPVLTFDDNEDGFSYLDMLADNNHDVFDEVSKNMLRDELLSCMRENLTLREFEVLSMRYGLDNGEFKALETVGIVLGLSKERIRQIEDRAKKKIKARCKDLELLLT